MEARSASTRASRLRHTIARSMRRHHPCALTLNILCILIACEAEQKMSGACQ
jgi:hypothetical protein